MDIEDAFTEEAITSLDTNVEGEEEAKIREVIQRIFVSNEINWSEDIMNVALLSFVAGRTYERGTETTITVPMSIETASGFIEYLAQRGQA